MSVGEIAGLIAAVAFVALVAFTAVPLLKLGRVLEEVRLDLPELYPESPDLDLVIGPPQVLEGSVGEAPGEVACPVHRGSWTSGKRIGKEPLTTPLIGATYGCGTSLR